MMNGTHSLRVSRSGSAYATAAGCTLVVLLVTLAGCATTGGGGGGLVPVRSDRPPTAGAAPDASRNPVNPVANDPAMAGADDVPVPPPTPVPTPGELVGTTASGGQITRRATAPVDSGPSAAARQVLFNAAQATSMTIDGWAWGGSLLAPRATVTHRNGFVDGQAVFNTLTSTGSYRCSGTYQGQLQ